MRAEPPAGYSRDPSMNWSLLIAGAPRATLARIPQRSLAHVIPSLRGTVPDASGLRVACACPSRKSDAFLQTGRVDAASSL